MRIAFGSDDDADLGVIDFLRGGGHTVFLARPLADPWPEVGLAVGEAVAGGAADVGIVCCWTGTGVSIAANKVPGVRAALCGDAVTAAGARRWNDANVLALSLRLTTAEDAAAIVDTFLTTGVDDEERPNIDRVPSGPVAR
jgi:ribose 5-phosphate isomerase B